MTKNWWRPTTVKGVPRENIMATLQCGTTVAVVRCGCMEQSIRGCSGQLLKSLSWRSRRRHESEARLGAATVSVAKRDCLKTKEVQLVY